MPAQREHTSQHGGAIVAGICSGLARRWGIDVGVLRFAFIALTIVTFGLFSLVYVVLWLLLPVQSIDSHTVDVKPDSFASETYGPRDAETARCRKRGERRGRQARKDRVDYSHVPPQSPQQAADAHYEASRAQSAGASGEASEAPVVVALVVGTTAVVAGMGAVISMTVPVFSPLQFWPLLLVGLGIVAIVVPSRNGYCMGEFVFGTALVCAGVVLALSTTGIFIVHYDAWLQQAWPLLFMSLGALFIWNGTYSNGFALLALALLVAFCAVAFLYCSEPGPAFWFLNNQPFAKDLPILGVDVR